MSPKGSSLTGKTNDRPDSLTSQTHYEVKNDKFGEIKYKQPNDYSINVTYYDEYSEIDNSFTPLEKSDRINN